MGEWVDPVEKNRFTKSNQADYPVKTICKVLGVSTSGFYAWLNRQPFARAREDERLGERIVAIHSRDSWRLRM